MQYIYILHLTPYYSDASHWTDETRAILDQHWHYLVGLHSSGVMQLVGRTNYDPGHKDLMGICVFNASSDTAAAEIMNNDPCVKLSVMTATVHPFNLALLEGRKP